MLRLQNVSVARGTRILYSGATLISSPGERIGLVGPNGSGKSTLFAAILGEIGTEAGDITTPEYNRISHVAQRIENPEQQAMHYVLEGHKPLIEAKSALAKAEQSHDDLAYASALAAYTEINEGAVVARAKEILHGLGFKDEDSERKVSEFSGGWRNRLSLARALLTPAELMLLDEPTNHLDIDSVIWLESWLKAQQTTIVVISHDREFLDRISQTIWSIEDGTIHRYSGNFSDYERIRAEKIKQQAAAAKAYEKTASHLQKFIDRFRYKATKAKQAQSRIKMLEKLQAIEPIKGSNEWRFNFAEPEKMPQHLIFAQELNCGYDGKPILTNVKVKVEPQDRIGVLGVNGAGKSTLIKTLIGELAAISGEIRYGTGLNIGYFAQHQLDQLREDESPLQHLTRIAPNVREQELRNYLGGFKFSNEMACSPVGPMSGGEKARLCLALIAWTKPNLLVLDEPTNHLDMETRDALTVALSSFEGAVLLVSHDRHLLKAVCDDLWIVHKGQVSEFLGDLEDYARIVLEDKKDKVKEAVSEEKDAPTVNKKEKRKLEAEERARISALRAPLQKQLKQVETALDKKSKKLKELNAQLAEEDFYQKDSALVSKTIKEQGELASEVEELELQWLDLSEQIESIV